MLLSNLIVLGVGIKHLSETLDLSLINFPSSPYNFLCSIFFLFLSFGCPDDWGTCQL